MGSKSKPKQTVAEYMMSMHFGVAHEVDSVEKVTVAEKIVWQGRANSNRTETISKPSLFGGVKKEGGVQGLMEVLLGGASQLLPARLAAKLGSTPENLPGYRGITSLFFTGGGPQGTEGFYWTANQPYLRPVEVTVRRSPKGFYPAKAMIERGLKRKSIFFALDRSGSMGGSKLTTLRTGMETVLGDIKRAVQAGIAIDVGVCMWASTSTTLKYFSATPEQIDLLIDLVNTTEASGGTDFTMAATPAKSFMDETLSYSSTEKRIFIFMTDGEPNVGTDDAAAAIIGDMLDRSSGNFQTSLGTAVDCYAMNIELGETSATAKLDNTPEDGVPVLSPTNPGPLVDAVSNALYGEAADANPAHIIYEALTNTDWGLGLSPTQLDIESFTEAADILFDERLGLSLAWSNQTGIEEFVNDILTHIDGTYGVDPATGKIYLSLVRGGYSLDDLLLLDDTKNCRVTRFQRKSLSETVNEVVVTWTNPENEQEETVVVHDTANYANQGVINSTASNYYGVRSAQLALKLASRDLARGSYPLATIDVEVDRSAWRGKPGDVIKLSCLEYGLVELPCRILTADYGRPSASKIVFSLVEDVFNMPAGAYVEAPSTEAVDPESAPQNVSVWQGGAVPYYFISQEIGSEDAVTLSPDDAYALILATSPVPALSFDVYTPQTNSLGTVTFEQDSELPVSGYATLSQPLLREAATTGVLTSVIIGNTTAAIGNFVWIGTAPASSELAVISGINSTTGALTLNRGVLDTNPKAWPAGTAVWFIDPRVDVSTPDLLIAGASGSYKLLMNTPSDQFPLAGASTITVPVDDRQARPYRPANVRINSTYWPTLFERAGSIPTVWSRRNRVLEEPTVLTWTAADVTPEVGTTYTQRLLRADNGDLLEEVTGLTGTSSSFSSTYSGQVTLKLSASRDGLESYQPFEHSFLYVTTELLIAEDGEWLLTEDGEELILET